MVTHHLLAFLWSSSIFDIIFEQKKNEIVIFTSQTTSLTKDSNILIQHAEGYLVPNGSTYKYVFNLTDHLGNVRVSVENNNGTPNPIDQTDYYPFGLEHTTNTANNYKYAYNGKEKQTEFGINWNDYGARNYDSEIGRWFNMDNHAESYKSWNPYNYAYNSPLIVVDPDGQDGIFINEKGKEIGNDGIDDGKVYVIKTSEKKFDSGVAANGITKKEAKATEEFVSENSGNTAAFQKNSIAYDNSVEIEGSTDTRQTMVDIVNQDNGKGGTSDANNREYGGTINYDGTVTQSPAGDVSTPVPNKEGQVVTAEINHTINSRTKSTFHSHPSGQVVIGGGDNSGTGSSTKIGGGKTTTHSWRQPPSPTDATNSTRTNYVFGRRSKTVYIYSGGGVIATLPQKRFVTPKN